MVKEWTHYLYIKLMSNSMKHYDPQCVSDMKNPLCHWYVRIYEKSVYMDNENVDKDFVTVNKGFQARFIEEVEARFIEWGYGEYRISFPFDGPGSDKPWNSDVKRLDIRYSDVAKYKVFGNYVFVLVIKVEKGFKSQCI